MAKEEVLVWGNLPGLIVAEVGTSFVAEEGHEAFPYPSAAAYLPSVAAFRPSAVAFRPSVEAAFLAASLVGRSDCSFVVVLVVLKPPCPSVGVA